mgnify:CR=1 FL=1
MPSEPPKEVPIQSTSTGFGEASTLRISKICVRHIPVRLTQLIAFATPRKVDTEHPVAIVERLGEGIEIGCVARHAMHTDYDAWILRFASLVIGQAAKGAESVGVTV